MSLESVRFLALKRDGASGVFLIGSKVRVRLFHRVKLGAADEDVFVWALNVSDLGHYCRAIADQVSGAHKFALALREGRVALHLVPAVLVVQVVTFIG